ncbi:serine threonine protein kinase [Chrysochromulina tobinii]|uniref:Serine threonine protein kinase n=1 Tax=Chrysochromulina tobinii TaxID=1460289 RepID=A0A0M0JJD3_9EUKA|nr:serine threonine protein kinase [Chrysochromulina tobinii]|eukprot:KOO26437.1 serine threonine protein kinase [Chrysochromulina sp. CCMP291]
MTEWRELSDGGYSEVYKAKLLGVTVAVKAATGRKKTSGESLLREIRYLQLCGAHPNIVQPYGAFVEEGRIHLVLEYARHCLRTDRVARSCDPIVVMAGVARALVRIHSLGIVHRDIKSRNVMVAVDNRALLIDFGLACDVERDGEEWLSRTAVH